MKPITIAREQSHGRQDRSKSSLKMPRELSSTSCARSTEPRLGGANRRISLPCSEKCEPRASLLRPPCREAACEPSPPIIEMFFHRRRHRVQPMHRADEIVERFPGATSSIRNGRMAKPLLTARSTSLGMWPEELAFEEKTNTITFAIVDCFDDGYAVGRPRQDVPRRDPATNTGGFQRAQTASATVLSLEA